MLKDLVEIDPSVLVGFDTSDDAAVIYVDQEKALVQTLDFFGPMVDDPFVYGQIAAANALSDVYAMGGVPFCAMNISCFPSCLSVDVIKQILRGGVSKLQEAGALLVGGHSVADDELKYGLSISGWVHPNKITTNRGAAAGDVLVLTKPIGTGLLINGIKAGLVSEETAHVVIQSMASLNRVAAQVMVAHELRCCTDVTGFGLLGHALEIARASDKRIELAYSQIPTFPEALACAQMGLVPRGSYGNHKHIQALLQIEELSEAEVDVLLDPQTSGGLLMACPQEKVGSLTQALADQGVLGAVIGRVQAGKAMVIARR